MALYMPPLCNKKRVEERYDPNTWRIFGESKDINSNYQSHYSATHTGERKRQTTLGRPGSKSRHNKPHPEKVGFLLQDCHLLHEPVCHVTTKITVKDDKECHWWPSRTSQEPLKKAEYSYSTTNRSDYGKILANQRPQYMSRHGSNQNHNAAQGIVPVNHLPPQNGPRLLVEKISYNHQYDSRKKSNEPPKGKLHGSIVWDTLYPIHPQSTVHGEDSMHSQSPSR